MYPSRLHPFSLVQSLRIATNGEGGAAPSYTYVELILPRSLVDAILRAESIELITLQKNGSTTGAAADLEWGVELVSGWDRDNELPTALLLTQGDISTNDEPKRHTAITAIDKFLPHSRVRIRSRNKPNVAGVHTAVVSVMVLVKLVSS